MTGEPKSRLNRRQFSIARLLIILSAVCVLLAVLSILKSVLGKDVLVGSIIAIVTLLPFVILLFVGDVRKLRKMIGIKPSAIADFLLICLTVFTVMALPFILLFILEAWKELVP